MGRAWFGNHLPPQAGPRPLAGKCCNRSQHPNSLQFLGKLPYPKGLNSLLFAAESLCTVPKLFSLRFPLNLDMMTKNFGNLEFTSGRFGLVVDGSFREEANQRDGRERQFRQ